MNEPTDMFGIPLEVGARVVYSYRNRSDTIIESGVVVAVNDLTQKCSCVIKTDKDDNLIRRDGDRLVNVTSLRDTYPEVFI